MAGRVTSRSSSGPVEPEVPGHAEVDARDAGHRRGRGEHHREERGHEDEEDRGRIADAEPEDGEGDPGQGREAPEEVHEGQERLRARGPNGRGGGPAGTPRTTARRKPAETRKSDAIASFTRRPLRSSWTRPRATAERVREERLREEPERGQSRPESHEDGGTGQGEERRAFRMWFRSWPGCREGGGEPVSALRQYGMRAKGVPPSGSPFRRRPDASPHSLVATRIRSITVGPAEARV